MGYRAKELMRCQMQAIEEVCLFRECGKWPPTCITHYACHSTVSMCAYVRVCLCYLLLLLAEAEAADAAAASAACSFAFALACSRSDAPDAIN